jgi:hypothetical protein
VTPELAAALRAEIRLALEADGKPFDVNVARRVYDLAIAARDMCIAATATTEEAIKAVADVGGPVESLTVAGATEPPSQAAESFGVRTLRELIAALRPVPGVGVVGPAPGAVVVPTAADLTTWIGALAEARSLGLDDVVAGIEAKLRAIGALADAAVAPPAPPYAVFDEAPPLDDPAAPVPGAAWDPNGDPPF